MVNAALVHFLLWNSTLNMLLWFTCGLSPNGSGVTSLVLGVVLWASAVPLKGEVFSARSQGWTSLGGIFSCIWSHVPPTMSSSPEPCWFRHNVLEPPEFNQPQGVCYSNRKWTHTSLIFDSLSLNYCLCPWFYQCINDYSSCHLYFSCPNFCQIISILSGHKRFILCHEFYSPIYISSEPKSGQFFVVVKTLG